jgi:predicted dehydrogenase
MLEKEQKNIDAVVVSTPDHCHAVAAVMAMKMGKHVYVQKPLAHSVSEARAMLEAARKHKVVTQMGTQAHPTYARLVELIQSGVIGGVKEVHVVTDRPAGWWPQGQTKPTTVDAVPSTLHWDQWLGPAAQRDYNKAYLPFVWRGWWDFGTGALGDMACHLMDGPWWALKLTAPTSVEAVSDVFTPDSPPLWSIITYEFPKREDMPPVKVVWYDGKKLPSAELREGESMVNGSLYIGEKGKIIVEHPNPPRLLPKAQFEGFKEPEPYLPRYGNHYKQWVDACVDGGETGSNFEYACPLTEAVLLGNVAIRTGKKIEWDAKKMRAKNCPEAEQYVKHHYRSGWSL